MNWVKNRQQANREEVFLISFTKYNVFLTLSWCFCTVLLLYYFLAKQSGYRFMGVTQAYQYRVQFKEAVVIDEILATSGQEVKKGETILKLSSSKLLYDLAAVNMKLYEKFSKYRLYNNIKDLDKFVKELRYKKEKTLLELEIFSSINIKNIIEKQIEKLEVKAPFDGYLGNLNFALDEIVPSFNPVTFVTGKNATIIKSYVLEDDPAAVKVSIGQEVNIFRADGSRGGKGKVFQIGAEVRELPARFQKTGYDRIYGREIFVKIINEAAFITGERILIEFSK